MTRRSQMRKHRKPWSSFMKWPSALTGWLTGGNPSLDWWLHSPLHSQTTTHCGVEHWLCVATCFVEFSGPLEEAWQRCLQDHDEVLQLLRHSHQQVLVHQVILGLFQGPSTACIPAHRALPINQRSIRLFSALMQWRLCREKSMICLCCWRLHDKFDWELQGWPIWEKYQYCCKLADTFLLQQLHFIPVFVKLSNHKLQILGPLCATWFINVQVNRCLLIICWRP